MVEELLPYEELKRIVRDLRRHLECAVCTNVLRRQTQTCVNGHCICNDCRGRQENCPTCREPFSNVRQNILARQILDVIPKKCQYDDCVIVVQSGDDHETYCIHRPTTCRICKEKVPVRELVHHVRASHAVCLGRNSEENRLLTINFIEDAVLNRKTLIQTDYDHLVWEFKHFYPTTQNVKFTYAPVFCGKPSGDLYVKVTLQSIQELEVKMKIVMKTDPMVKNCFFVPISEEQMFAEACWTVLSCKYSYAVSRATFAVVKDEEPDSQDSPCSSTQRNGLPDLSV